MYMESSKETGCQPLEGPILCANNCGFFGSAATMNMCSKCHKDTILKQEQAQLAASSIENIVNGSQSKGPTIVEPRNDKAEAAMESNVISMQSPCESSSEVKAKEGPHRCTTCRKRIGLTGFSCRCGNMFCVAHRYSDKHECPFDYRTPARNAITKANPIVKARKLDKI